jgi:hypothetical protein
MIATALHAEPALSFDPVRLADAIAQVEGHRATDLGGRYAISRAVWTDTTRLPYHLSRVPEYADAVAKKRLRDLVTYLEARGYSANAYSVAGAWRWGLEGYIARERRGRVEYGVRVWNLYHSAHAL